MKHIRAMYNAHIPHREAYEEYKDKIGESGFTKIWTGITWRNVAMDVYTEDNKRFHKTISKRLPRNMVHNAKLSEQDVMDIQAQRRSGYKIKDIYQNYQQRISFSGFENIWYEI